MEQTSKPSRGSIKRKAEEPPDEGSGDTNRRPSLGLTTRDSMSSVVSEELPPSLPRKFELESEPSLGPSSDLAFSHLEDNGDHLQISRSATVVTLDERTQSTNSLDNASLTISTHTPSLMDSPPAPSTPRRAPISNIGSSSLASSSTRKLSVEEYSEHEDQPKSSKAIAHGSPPTNDLEHLHKVIELTYLKISEMIQERQIASEMQMERISRQLEILQSSMPHSGTSSSSLPTADSAVEENESTLSYILARATRAAGWKQGHSM